MKRRKPRKGEHTCRCGAYEFPHRFGGGRCTGVWVAKQQWEKAWGSGECRQCHCCNRNDVVPYCEVVEGQERVTECPVFQDFVQYNEIRYTRE